MKRPAGFTLIEMLVAMAVGLVAVLAMAQLMANTLGTSTRTVKMTNLTQQLRSTLQLMSRDVRRASYSSDAILCYANIDCGSDGSLSLPGDIGYNAASNCFTYQHDRNHDGNATNDGAGGFRLAQSGSVGVLEMWTGTSAADCTSGSSDWLAITDPEIVNVYQFQVDDDASYSEVIDVDGSGSDVLQKVRKVRMRLGGRLIFDPQIFRVVEETIRVRNDLVL